ncbi:uncharacterized protein HNR44_001348 [Geomicrobium halophilum]|uniref:DUF177 domain-containing protein n=1 Tax=Geomicrobium halophilum TaxID=549000 RepID=A0A841PKX7_9BACL|nr:YceD family protein [Geomicrobium halophilum]MBB6449399.1 uncharacterized protein [Geomicrobium halophilum]
MRWTIQQLLAIRSDNVEIDHHIDVSDLVERDKEMIDISKAHVRGRIEVDYPYARFHLSVQGTMTLPDSNTLADTEVPFDIVMTERFRLDGQEVPADDETLHLPENGYVDILPYIKEDILLAIPMRVRNDKAPNEGPAPQSGTDWSVVTAEEHEEQTEAEPKVDPRLADLAYYFKDEK